MACCRERPPLENKRVRERPPAVPRVQLLERGHQPIKILRRPRVDDVHILGGQRGPLGHRAQRTDQDEAHLLGEQDV
jgi:hypothetical protein